MSTSIPRNTRQVVGPSVLWLAMGTHWVDVYLIVPSHGLEWAAFGMDRDQTVSRLNVDFG